MEAGKNKKVTYLLICAVAAVWGIIVYRVFFNESGDDEVTSSFKAKTADEPYDKYVAKNDTFKLALSYRDPFLGKAAVVAEVVKAGPAVEHALPVPIKPFVPALNWSSIKYSGYITNPKTKNIVSIVTVNGKERMIGEGEIFEGVKLLKNKRDSILVSWLGKQKYIKQ